MKHTIGGLEFLVWEIFITHDKCVGRWSPPPHHPKTVPYKNQTPHPLPLPCVWPILPYTGWGVQNLGDCWGFGLMARSEAHGSWHWVLLLFAIFTILRISEWLATDYQNSLVFMNETRTPTPQPQVTLLMKNMMWKYQGLTHMFSKIYGWFRNQLSSW